MPYFEAADGTRLFYNDWQPDAASDPANRERPMVFIHGWPLSADMWEYQLPWLCARGQRCIAYDRRGFGRSDQPWDGYDYDTLADDLAALLEYLDLNNVTLVGYSMGGGEVARYLARHGSGRIAGAVLVSSVLPFLLKGSDNPEGVDPGVFDALLDGLAKDRPAQLAAFGKQVFGAGPLTFSISSEVLDWTAFMALHASPRATEACVRAFATTDFRSDMAAFDIPTLIIHGADDHTVPLAASATQAARLLPAARLIVYSEAPHATFFTDRERLNHDLLAFATREAIGNDPGGAAGGARLAQRVP